MELTNDFTVPVGIERAWEVLTDVELIAPCLPGAQLQEVDGEEYRGTVKVKVGPITAQYKGTATFKEKDEESRRLVLEAGGRDTRGQGSADAVITVTMAETDGSTHVEVHSDVTIKGKVAQFGRGMIADVSAKLLTQFVECLEGKLDEPAPSTATTTPAAATVPAATATTAPAGNGTTDGAEEAVTSNGAPAAHAGPRQVDQPEAAPVDLLDTAGAPVAKRIAPIVAVIVVLVLIGRRRSKKRRAAKA